MTHGDLVNILLRQLDAFGLFWPNATGKARSMDGRRVISYGFKGSPDIIGVLNPTGRFVGVECKVKLDRQRPDQRTFERVSTLHGAIYILAQSRDGTGDDAVSHVRNILNGL